MMRKKCKSEQENATKSSYKASYGTALADEVHNVAEPLVKPVMADVVSCVFGKGSVEKIKDIASNIKMHFISRLNNCNVYALQLKESTNIAGLAILLAFKRYSFNEGIQDDLLLCESLELHTTNNEIFDAIDNIMEAHEIDWEKCISVCSDGAKAMTENLNGTVIRIKNISKNCKSVHCILHRYALVTKKISSSLTNALIEAIQIANFIKSQPLQSCFFKQLCESMGSDHTTSLPDREIKRFSGENVLV